MARPTTLRRVTSDVEELAFLLTSRARLWWHCRGEDKSALATFPICLIALWTDVSGELPVCGVPAVGAFISFLFILHDLHLMSFDSVFKKISTFKNL